jgi:dienelactone hydrolase
MSQSVPTTFTHLGPFSDLVTAARALRPLFPSAPPGTETRKSAREVFGFTVGSERPEELRLESSWSADGVDGEQVSWSVGFGPRTSAWVLKPSDARGPLPGILALHDHGHFKFYGKEKIADGPEGPVPTLKPFRAAYYGGRAYCNLLAREGFVVVVHDAFLWGSRGFPLDAVPETELKLAQAVETALGPEAASPDGTYNGAAYLHEHLVSKYCTLLGTNIAAVVAYEDRVALNYLRERSDVLAEQVGCIGLSGGGLRAAVLRATHDLLGPCMIAGMMSTYDELIDRCIAPHTWMLFPAGWSTRGDWPDLAASAAPAPLLIQYLLDDAQFTVAGMRAADAQIAAHYRDAQAPEAYRGEFYPGPHRFDAPMQQSAFSWLKAHLRS